MKKEKRLQLEEGIGALMFILGLSGMADAVTGQGSFMIAAIVFSIGFGLSIKRWVKE